MMVDLKESNEDGLAGMSGMTAYNRVDGEFFLHQMPIPEEQVVKQTIQGVVDEFIYSSEEVSLQSILKQNEPVKITENTYIGETKSVYNRTETSYSTDSGGDPFNRIIIQGGAGSYDETLATNLSASVHDEIIAVAVDDIRPFLIKGLDTDYTGEIKNDKPTNDGYIKHLTPTDRTVIASIKSPAILTSAGGPSRILVYYDAIDLTGEVVAGTGLTPSQVNPRIRPYHVQSNKPYLVVKKTVPSGSTLFNIAGTYRSLSDILLKPYTSAPGTASDVQLEVIAAGGIVEIPTQDFKRPIKSHLLKAHGFDGSFPSPFINIENCVLTIKDGLSGYGRPKAIENTNTPDPTANPSHHVMTVSSSVGENLTAYTGTTQTPSSFARSSLQVFNILDNEITQNQHFILVAPANPNRYAGLEDFLSASESVNPPLITIEIALLNGRAEEFNTLIGNEGASLEIRGRSNLMDVTDSEIKRNLNLGETTPLKEIGDLGTPTVSMTLGGVGQGGVDVKTQRTEHDSLKGWKDKIVSSGNVSVRNDKQTSTDYASTRALVELPIFPTMFFDKKGLYEEIDGITTGVHARGKEFKIGIDCTMTAMNRVQMQTYEARNAVDWGAVGGATITYNDRTALSKTDTPYSFGLKAIHPKIQAVIASIGTPGAAIDYITVDSVDAFVNDTLQGSHGINRNTSSGELGQKFYVLVGQGEVSATSTYDLSYATYFHMRVWKIDTSNNRLYIDKAFLRHPRADITQNLTSSSPAASALLRVGMSVQMGGVIVNNLASHNAEMAVDWGNANIPAAAIQTAIQECVGMSSSICSFQGITHELGMGCLEWDVFNEWGHDNNRQLKEPIEVKSVSNGLAGIKSDGTGLTSVQVQHINFRHIALKSASFEEAVNNLIRKINMAGHPDAIEIGIFDANDADLTPGSAYTSHMGYVRAFLGDAVESRDGEDGVSIVIHSTVPGASGRNFAVTLSNDSYYPYRPIQAFGHGGLLATNSRSYQLNSFPAPMPIGADGETYAPITTFTGAVHGPITHPHDALNTQRTYNGIGQRMTVTTKATSSTLSAPYSWDAGNNRMSYVVVDGKAADYRMRANGTGKGGIVRINGRYATFDDLRVNYDSTVYNHDEMYFINVTPLIEPDKFEDSFKNSGGTNVTGLEVEIVYPLMDSEGIIFFGGGHTGLTFDISDGSKNDYSNFYKHPLANGPTGFSGFQNLGRFSQAHAVLDFTDIVNEDTINDDTLRGLHHKTIFNSNNEPEGKCAFYCRVANGVHIGEDVFYNPSASGSAAATYNMHTSNGVQPGMREELYNRKVRLSGDFVNDLAGPTNGTEVTPTGASLDIKEFMFGHSIALFNNNGGTIEHEHGEVKDFVVAGNTDWCVSCVVKQGSHQPYYPTGPIWHGITNDGTTAGKPYGLHLGAQPTTASPGAANVFPITFAISYPKPVGSPVAVSVLCPAATPSGTVEIRGGGWTFIMAGRVGGLSFLYLGNTAGITNPLSGASEVGIFDYSDFLLNTTDNNYLVGIGPNARSSFDTRSNSYGGGVPDHPNVSAGQNTIRDIDMTLIGGALIGAPFIHHLAPTTTQGGHTQPPISGYFTELASPTQTYGVVAAQAFGSGTATHGTGTNHAGPIHFNGYLGEVALWKRSLSFAEAQEWFNSRTVW